MINDYSCTCSNCEYHKNNEKFEEYDFRIRKIEDDKFKNWQQQIDALQTGINNVYNQFKELQDGTGLKTIQEITEANRKVIIDLKSLDALILNRMKNLYGMQDDFQKQIEHLKNQNMDRSREIENLRFKYEKSEIEK